MRTVRIAAGTLLAVCACGAPAPHANDAAAIVVEPAAATALPSVEPPAPPAAPMVMIARTQPERLQIEDIVLGRGAEASPGRRLQVSYICTLTDGTMVDNSARTGRPFEFKLGSGMVIKGWEQGVDGMRVGGRRRLTIPPDLAYGERGRPPVIPENATLIFDIELVGVQ